VTTPALVEGRRRPFTDYVPVWAIALLVIAIMWAAIISLAASETFPTQATITGLAGSSVTGNKCAVAWTSPAGKPHTSDVACLGRPVGSQVTLLLSDPEGETFADRRALFLLEWIGLLFTGLPGLLGVGGRVLGIRRARILGSS
jgi:hypothetical protein